MAGRATKRQKRSNIYLPDSKAQAEETKSDSYGESINTVPAPNNQTRSLESPNDLSPTEAAPISPKLNKLRIRSRASHSTDEYGYTPVPIDLVDTKEQEVHRADDNTPRTGNHDSCNDDDIIDDYDSYDELFNKFADEDASLGYTHNFSVSQGQPHQSQSQIVARPSKKYSTPPRRFIVSPAADYKSEFPVSLSKSDSQLPWAQKFPPRDLDELAVHKKKVSDVREWLKLAFSGRTSHKLLVLRGPAGSGKSATVSLLSITLGFEMVEWKNPPVSDYGTGSYVSLGKKLDEFLERGNGFNVLDLDLASQPFGSKYSTSQSSPRRILLIEEFPTLNRHSPGLAAFRLSLQRCLATASQPKVPTSPDVEKDDRETAPPVVIIVSETHLSSETSPSENVTAYRLLGAEICNHPDTTVIDFNSIAPTIMQKALGLVLNKNTRHSGGYASPGDAVIRNISKVGDIRSAINALQVLCLQSNELQGTSDPLCKKTNLSRATNPKKPPGNAKLGLTGQREITLGLFHAVGKIMYNKRQEFPNKTGAVQQPCPPSHLLHHDRPAPSQVSVDDLVGETGTDIQTFIGALHENYVPSCDGPSFTGCLNGCIDALSDSDLLCVGGRDLTPSWTGSRITAYRNKPGLDVLRQDEISYQVATRGILFSLPHPVKRCAPAGRLGRKSNAHQMYFPAMFRLMHEMEEIEGLANLWAKRVLSSSMELTIEPMPKVGSGTILQSNKIKGVKDSKYSGMYRSAVTMISRNDLFLYQLPYLAMISNDSTSSQEELQRLIGFERMGAQTDVYENAPDCSPNELMGSSSFPLRRNDRAPKRAIFGSQLPPGHEKTKESLVLNDDDIMDD